jgi:hypothetical protein
MAPIQNGGQISVKLSSGTKTKGLGAKQSKVICIMFKSISCQSRPYEYQLEYLHINQGRMNNRLFAYELGNLHIN